MATTKYSDLLPFILPDVPGCSDPLAEQAVLGAVIEFCDRSLIWTHAADPQNAVAGQSVYDVDLPAGAALVRIKSVAFDGIPITASSEDAIAADIRDWQNATGTPLYYLQFEPSEFRVVPTPTASSTNSVTTTLFIKPSRASTGFPDWINERYQDALVAGAKARLMKKVGTTWFNAMAAVAHDAEFDRGVSTAKEDASRSLVRAVHRTTTQH